MDQCVVTIYIHGTLPPAPVLRIPMVYSFFYCPGGLTRVRDMNEKWHTAKFIRLLCGVMHAI